MPTSLPRFQVTQTPDIVRALKVARRRWPEATRSELVTQLFLAGAEALDHDAEKERERRLRIVDFSSGAFDADFGDDYLDDLRSEWPE